eukprot:11163113-Alexandrium_andersonii.AAC.1
MYACRGHTLRYWANHSFSVGVSACSNRFVSVLPSKSRQVGSGSGARWGHVCMRIATNSPSLGGMSCWK